MRTVILQIIKGNGVYKSLRCNVAVLFAVCFISSCNCIKFANQFTNLWMKQWMKRKWFDRNGKNQISFFFSTVCVRDIKAMLWFISLFVLCALICICDKEILQFPILLYQAETMSHQNMPNNNNSDAAIRYSLKMILFYFATNIFNSVLINRRIMWKVNSHQNDHHS